MIHNYSEDSENITITIKNSKDDQIFKQTDLISPNEIREINRITNKEGRYSIFAYVDENRSKVKDDIKVEKYHGYVEITIYNDSISIHQVMD